MPLTIANTPDDPTRMAQPTSKTLAPGALIEESAAMLSTLADGFAEACAVELDPSDMEEFQRIVAKIRLVLAGCHDLVRDGRKVVRQVENLVRETVAHLELIRGSPDEDSDSRIESCLEEGWRRQQLAARAFPELEHMRRTLDEAVHALGAFRLLAMQKSATKTSSSWFKFLLAATFALCAVTIVTVVATGVFCAPMTGLVVVGGGVSTALMYPSIRELVRGVRERILGRNYRDIFQRLENVGNDVQDMHHRLNELDEFSSIAHASSDRTIGSTDEGDSSCHRRVELCSDETSLQRAMPNLPKSRSAIAHWISEFRTIQVAWFDVSKALDRLSAAQARCTESLAFGCRASSPPKTEWCVVM
jgi:hypothetical protein